MTNQSYAQAGDIDRSRIISGPIPEALGIGAAEPGSPVIDLVVMVRRRVRVGGTATTRTDMRGMAGLLPLEANSRQETFVAQHSPQFPTHLGVVPPIAPAPLGSSPTPGGFHRLEGFARDQLAVKGGGEHQQDIGRQVC